MENKKKETVIRTSVFFAVVFAMFVILAAISIPIDIVKDTGIRQTVQSVLDTKWPDTYVAGERVDIDVPLTVSAYAYRVSSLAQADFTGTAVLMRVTGISGPVPVVFLAQNERPAVCAGFAGMDEPAGNPSAYGITDSVLQYWQDRIRDLPIGETHE